MSSSVDLIKSKIDIVSLISSYIKLEKAGTNFKGRCPFHNEKTPSFFVSPDRGSYYCFGCHAKGDIFTFVQEFEGLDFLGSLRVLADRAGVDIEKYSGGEKTEKDRLLSVLDQAVFFYQMRFKENSAAEEYLAKRGVTPDTIQSFRIGYAPLEWRELYQYLKSKNVSDTDMLDVGLVKRKEGSVDSFYDTFRGRVMFPIADSSGMVVGFSGRILVPDDRSPKYLNSPETALFNKSEILFGLDKAKKDIRLRDYSILVEGQMDLVMLHQAGLSNTVASSGTALTESQLVKLRRLSNRIIMAYDGDGAGFAASNRSAHSALKLGMELKIAQMPEGVDPADLAKDNVEKLKEVIRGAKHIIDFYTDNLLEKNVSGRELGEEIRKNVLPYVSMIPSAIERAHFIRNIAKKTYIKEDALWDDLTRSHGSAVEHPSPPTTGTPPAKRINVIERKVLGIIMWQKSLKNNSPGVDVVHIENKADEIFKGRMEELLLELEKEKELLLFETESYYNNKENLNLEINELLRGLEEEHLKRDFAEAMKNLQKAEQLRNSSDVLKYLEECQSISQKLNTIKNGYEKK